MQLMPRRHGLRNPQRGRRGAHGSGPLPQMQRGWPVSGHDDRLRDPGPRDRPGARCSWYGQGWGSRGTPSSGSWLPWRGDALESGKRRAEETEKRGKVPVGAGCGDPRGPKAPGRAPGGCGAVIGEAPERGLGRAQLPRPEGERTERTRGLPHPEQLPAGQDARESGRCW